MPEVPSSITAFGVESAPDTATATATDTAPAPATDTATAPAMSDRSFWRASAIPSLLLVNVLGWLAASGFTIRASIVLVGGLAIWFWIVWLMFDRSSIRGELYALRKERRREERKGRLLGDAITP